jgi:TetR/AcrR family transcriptional regulator
MQAKGGLPADMDWRLIQLATLSLATYPIAFTQLTRMVTGRDATDPAFQAEWTAFLRVLGEKLFS